MITKKAIDKINKTIDFLYQDAKRYPFNKDIQKALHELRLRKTRLITRYKFFN